MRSLPRALGREYRTSIAVPSIVWLTVPKGLASTWDGCPMAPEGTLFAPLVYVGYSNA